MSSELRSMIVSLDATSLRVDGGGLTGACGGDSGGPLLARRQDGSFEVLGILSVGSRTCRGIDVHLRVDTQLRWLGQSGTGPCSSSSETAN
jgi:secreted trypsin-like serine protease